MASQYEEGPRRRRLPLQVEARDVLPRSPARVASPPLSRCHSSSGSPLCITRTSSLGFIACSLQLRISNSDLGSFETRTAISKKTQTFHPDGVLASHRYKIRPPLQEDRISIFTDASRDIQQIDRRRSE